MHEDPSLRNLPPRAEALAARHEVEDMPLGGIKGFVVFLALMIAGTFVVVWVVTRLLLHLSVSGDQTVSPFAGVVPPEPRIQPSRDHNTLDWQDLKGLRDEEYKKLHEYAWIGADKQSARIPIEEAMKLVLAQGLPTRQGSATGGPAALPGQGGVGGLMVAPANPLTLPPGNLPPGNQPTGNERTGYVP
jgi:hypothetical protein